MFIISSTIVSILVLSFKYWKRLNCLCQCLIVPVVIISTLASLLFVPLLHLYKDEKAVTMAVANICSLTFIINIFVSTSLFKLFK